jgi:hypothetical protein
MKTKEKIDKQHVENRDWVSQLDFYKDDIRILTERLEDIAEKNSSYEVLAEVEKFQNQFIVQRNNIDEIEHLITVNDGILLRIFDENPVTKDHQKVEFHAKEKELVETFENNFKELSEDFKSFEWKCL